MSRQFRASDVSVERSFLAPQNVRPFKNFAVDSYEDLESLQNLGITIRPRELDAMINHAMDAVQPLITTASSSTPIQFLQNWLPGFVEVITAARKIDQLIGISTVGSWEDEQVVQGVLELVGTSVPYGDYTNIPLSSWNVNFNYRTVVRFEEGMQVGLLEERNASRIRVDSGERKRASAALALEIIRNSVGFFGYNSGNNLTYGFLNDPGLPNYVTVPNGASGSPHWSTKTFLEICADIRTMFSNLQNNSQDQIDPETTPTTLALATSVYTYLTVVSDFGISVRQWLRETFPKCRVVSAPELNGANGGANVGYLFADYIDDTSTDDRRTFMQNVTAKFQVLGVQQLVKGYQEGYSNATAGTMCKRPWAVVRDTGL